MSKRVIVIGSGIIGASAAYHLAKAGAEVSIIEAGEPGGIATRASWAWINASWGNPEPYFRLRLRSIEHWHKMQSEIPALAINWCGGLIWDLPPAELDAYAAERAKWGQPLRKVGRGEIFAIEPNLKTVPEHGYFAPGEGMLEPLATARVLLDAARSFGAEVLARLRLLGMANSRFEVALTPLDKPAAHGLDDVEFLISANPGQPLKGLARVASGGELSRVSLAIQVVNAKHSPVPVMVFDEVDVARQHQVFVVTHLAQVAAVADRHIVVRKQIVTVDGAERTRASAEVVTGNDRVDEVARMLSGRPDSAAARRHARELLAG